MKISFNNLERSYKKYKSEFDNAAIEVLESGWYILGEKVEKFERQFCKFLNTKHCIGLNSGLDALTLAFRALNIKNGDEVIVPANTYIGSILGITENGAVPILIEPDEFYNIDTNKIEEKINRKTKAILAVHLYGQSAEISKLRDITESSKLYLVEDCAQSHGACFNNKMTGTWGDVGCFSFYPTKNIGAFGDSGAIVTKDEEIYERVKKLRNYGSIKKYENEILGVNSRMDEIQAALLSVRLKHYCESKFERDMIANEYLSRIKNPLITLPTKRVLADHVWHLFVIRTKKRNELQEYLLQKGISTQIHYPIPPHLSAAYKYLNYKYGDLPITEDYANTVLSLPLYEGMTKTEIDYVIEAINSFE